MYILLAAQDNLFKLVARYSLPYNESYIRIGNVYNDNKRVGTLLVQNKNFYEFMLNLRVINNINLSSDSSVKEIILPFDYDAIIIDDEMIINFKKIFKIHHFNYFHLDSATTNLIKICFKPDVITFPF